jgi:hypothetical protein
VPSAREAVARARCIVAEAEIALVSRDLSWPAKTLDAARATLEAHGDRVNAAHARYLEVRRLLLIGRLDEAERTLSNLNPAPFPPASRTAHELVVAGIAMRRHGGMNRSAAEIVREYGPFAGVDHVHGFTYDGHRIWFAAGDKLNALDPASGEVLRSIDVAAHAGTAFDGGHLYQLAEDRIQKIDPKTGHVLATIPAPGGGGDSGLAWAEGTVRAVRRPRRGSTRV